MRRRAPRPLGPALAGLAERLAPATTLARVQACWADAAGPAIAREAEPVAERDGVLTVACRSSVWAQELEMMSAELLDRLNAALGGREAGPAPAAAPPLRAIRARTARAAADARR